MYKHGGGYKKAALEQGLNWKQVTDYSTSINWKATEFYPEGLIYLHQENIEYPEPDYRELKEVISAFHGYDTRHFLMTHGANEAISYLFYMFLLQGYKDKTCVLVGPTYSEYNKCCDLNGFQSIKAECCINAPYKDKIIIIVNPNTPLGIYQNVESLLNSGNIVVIDESFIDFTSEQSMYKYIKDYPNLYIIHSMTKFYGAAGSRLGLILSSNRLLNDFMSVLLPPWTISAYDSWFYRQMIPKHKQIKAATLEWVTDINQKTDSVIKKSKNIRNLAESITSYRTLELSDEIEIPDFLNKYKIYIRPASDFFGCPKNSFRIGLRLPEENEPLFRAIEAIG